MTNLRNPNQNSVAPAYQEQQPAHMQQAGMMSAPVDLHKQFFFSSKSEVDGQTYEGQFTVKKLSIRDIAKIGVRQTQLNGGFHYDENKPGSGVSYETDMINQMMSYLEVAVVQAPMWFNLDKMYDANILMGVFQKATEHENNFFRSSRQATESAGSGQNAGSSAGPESGSVGRVEKVVGEKVQTTLDP